MKNLFLRSVMVVAIGMSVAAHAADMPTKAPITPPPAIQGWTYSLTPYFWAVSLNGSTTAKGRTADVDAGFFDIWSTRSFQRACLNWPPWARRVMAASACSPTFFTLRPTLVRAPTRSRVRMDRRRGGRVSGIGY